MLYHYYTYKYTDARRLCSHALLGLGYQDHLFALKRLASARSRLNPLAIVLVRRWLADYFPNFIIAVADLGWAFLAGLQRFPSPHQVSHLELPANMLDELF